jgi:hypothetical protein
MSLSIIKAWALFQLFVLVFMIIFFKITRWFISRTSQKNRANKKKIIRLLKEIDNNPEALSPKVITFLNHSIVDLLFCMEKADRKNSINLNWIRTKKLLSEHVLKNQSVKLAKSKNWFKRQLTLLCYELGDNIADEKTLLKFVKDNNLIVATNAAIELFKKPTSSAINEVITTLSNGRHVVESTVVNMLTTIPSENINLIRTTFIDRLKDEKNTYVRIFCYRILTHLKPVDKVNSFVKEDLLSTNADLKILALKYIVHVDPVNSTPVLLNYINDSNNDVRAVVTKLLGNSDDESVIPYLSDKLKDSEWWVRINSADSLLKLGTKGIAVLKQQSPQIDKFAYETAQACLQVSQHRDKE